MSANLWKTGTQNAFNTTLNGNVLISDTSIILTTTTGLQAPGVVVIDRVDSNGTLTPIVREYVSYTGISVNTLTGCTRGLGGSTQQAHSSGAKVEEVFTITHWNDLLSSLANVLTSAGGLDTTKVVDLTSGQTLTNKTLTSPIVSQLQGTASHTQFPAVIGEFNNGNSGSTITIDWSKGDRQLVTISAAATLSWSNAIQGQTLTLRVVENGTGGFSVTLPSGKWPSGSAGTFSTTANAINLLITYYDGANYLYQLATGFA